MKIIKIDTEGNILNINLDFQNNIKKSLKNIDENIIELLYEWKIDTNTIQCYGCLDSDCNIKNKHILPRCGIPSNEINSIIDLKSEECNIYGNIYIVCKNNINNYIDFYDYDYGVLYFNIVDCIEDLDIIIDNKEECTKKNFLNINNIKNINDENILDYDNNLY